MPKEVRDPYSKAKLFIPTQQEKSISAMEKELRDKLDRVDEILNKIENKETK